MAEPTTVRTRFAPSPSGHLHVGGARTALFCWAFARQHGGRFIVRIEDTDQKRSSDAASLGFLQDLKWLGIEWNEGPQFEGCGGGECGPYVSSERLALYHSHAQQLIDAGLAYRAFETPQELDAARREAMTQKRNYRYDRAALQLDAATVTQYVDEGRPHVVRLKLPDVEDVTFRDEVRGELRVGIDELDDFVILKADGWPTYHFAVVVDDELMNVTHIIRGQEHQSNTFKHVLLQDALGFRRPEYAHLSLISNPDGSKMSKRDKAKVARHGAKQLLQDMSEDQVREWYRKLQRRDMDPSGGTFVHKRRDIDHKLQPSEFADFVAGKTDEMAIAEVIADELKLYLPEIEVQDFQVAGYLPGVLVNYLALLGWSPGGDVEKFDLEFLKNNISLDRIIKAPAKFDRDKLLAFNHDAIQAMDADAFARLFVEHVRRYHPEFTAALGNDQLLHLGRANHPRSKTLDDQVESSRFFIMNDDAITYDLSEKPIRKALTGGEPCGYDYLEQVLPVLRDLPDWTVEALESAVNDFAAQQAEGKLGKVAQPLRIAVCGGTISPAIFDTLAILGREATLRRIERCLKQREVLNEA